MAEPLSVAANVSQIGQLVASAGAAYVAASSRHDDVIDIATRRIDMAASALSKLSNYTELSPGIAKVYYKLEGEFISLNEKFETTLAYDEELEKKFWLWKHYVNCLHSAHLKTRPAERIQEVSDQMQKLTLRAVSASAGAESKFKRIAQIVRKDFTHDLDIKMLQLYAQKKPSMTKTEFLVSVRRTAATVLPTPDAVELYITLFSQKLDALENENESEESAPTNPNPTESISGPSERNAVQEPDVLPGSSRVPDLNTYIVLQKKHKASNPFIQRTKPDAAEHHIPMVDICNKATISG